MSFTPVHLLVDFGIISVLLVAAQVLRYRFRLVQALHLPTAIVAGLIALVLGPYGLQLLPFAVQESGAPYMATYPTYLIAIVFAALALGHKPRAISARQMLRDVGDTFFYNTAAYVGQYGIALLFGLLVLGWLFPALPDGFALLLPTGFAGGHGTAAAVGSVLEQRGWDEALPLAYTSATVGVTIGIAGGMALIHLGIRRGWTRLVASPSEMPRSFKTGFVPPHERLPAGYESVSPVTIDAVTWHLALAGAAVGLAYGVSSTLPDGHGVPLFALALIAGWVVNWALRLLGMGGAIDGRLMGRVSATAADYLIAFGVASIAILVVLEYIVPLLLLFVFGLGVTLFMFWVVGRRIFHNYWFERSIFVFGWTTGVVAIGIMLLRVVDPEAESGTLEDFGLAYTVLSFIELAIVTALPLLVAEGVVLGPALLLTGGAVACLLISRWLFGWSDGRAVVARRTADDPSTRPVAPPTHV